MAAADARSSTGRSAARSRRRLLDAAAEALRAGGGAMEVQDVARRAGVSVGLAYHRFGSKAGLVAAVVERFHEALDAATAIGAEELPDPADWPARERERTRRLVRFLAEDPLAPVVLDKLARDPEVAAVDAACWARVIREGARNIAQGQRRGFVPADRDPALLAALVIGAVRHAVGEALRGGGPRDADALADEIWTFLGAGMGLRRA